MHVTIENLHQFLVDVGLLRPGAALDGYELSSATRRNRNLRLRFTHGGGYLVKQPEWGTDGSVSLRREIEFYRFCESRPESEPLRHLIPRARFLSPKDSILVLDLIDDVVPLWISYGGGAEKADGNVRTASAVGAALATVHSTLSDVDPQMCGMNLVSSSLPRVLTLDEPDVRVLQTITRPAYEVLKLIQTSDELTGQLNDTRRLWQASTLIHGDVKLDNILVGNGLSAQLPALTDVFLVDWELIQYGDPAWDLAGALQDFLVLWVMNLPSADSLDGMLENEVLSLGDLKPATASLWSSYLSAHGLTPTAGANLLERAIQFCAARLVQSAFELALGTTYMPARSLLFLQLAANIWKSPATTARELFALEPV